jgi:hypothetical protein
MIAFVTTRCGCCGNAYSPQRVRNDTALTAAKEIGYGWGFGVHEALDQFGALFGPLMVAAVLAHRGNYRMAFAVLVVPAVITYSLLIVARSLYPRPEELGTKPPDVHATGLPRIFWIYLAGAALVAAGFADFQLIAYHFAKANAVSDIWMPVMYSAAMAVSGLGSLLFGELGEAIDGERIYYNFMRPTTSTDQLALSLSRAKALGYDMVRIGEAQQPRLESSRSLGDKPKDLAISAARGLPYPESAR